MDKLLLFGIFLLATAVITPLLSSSSVYATGCPANFVKEHVDQAVEAYEKGDMQEVKNQLDLAQDATKVFEEEDE